MVGKSLKKWWPVFVLPTLAAFIIGFLWPFIWGIYLSFCKFSTVKDVVWVGLSNYQKIFIGGDFSHAFWLTVVFAFVSSILINVLAFSIALALTKGFKGTNVFRTVFFMPNLIGGIVLGYIWQTLLNGLLSMWGQPLLKLSATNGFIGMIILLLWQQIGYMMIIYIAGIQNISSEMLEAAQVDGANWHQRLFNIIIPSVRPSIIICVFLTLTNGFKLFDQNLALTGGEPSHGTEMVALNIYNTFYGSSADYRGVGQAKAVIFAIILAIIGFAQMKIQSERGEK